MRYSFSRQNMAMVFVLMSLSATNIYAESAKVVVIPLGADALPAGVLSGQEIISSPKQPVSIGGIAGAFATCPNSKIVLGGGFVQTNDSGDPAGTTPNPLSAQANYPFSRNTWAVTMENTSTAERYFRAYAVCAKEN